MFHSILPLLWVCSFTFIIHMTESVAYSMRLAGYRSKQIAIAMSFVTSTLLISRLSNMMQAPIVGAMVDGAILDGGSGSLMVLEWNFRFIILSAFFGALLGSILTPSAVGIFQKGIESFLVHGSIPKVVLRGLRPRNIKIILSLIRLPRISSLKSISLKGLPKQFLVMNIFVTSIYCIGVLCSLLAGAHLPEFRSTAIQLSGIVNGMATIMFSLLVDPPGARITDQAIHGKRSEDDVRSVVFFLQLGKMAGTLIVAQLLFKPLTHYIMLVTKLISNSVI